MKRALVAGCGFLGLEVARLLIRGNWQVTGVVHSPESAQALSSEPFEVRVCDVSNLKMVQETLGDLRGLDVVVQCVSSGRGGAEQYRLAYLEGTRSLMDVLTPERVVFTSSTSVYAQVDGSIVTEESETAPQRETGKVLLETEALTLIAGGVVARVAGLYGPGRSVLLRKFFDGSAKIEGEGDKRVNQVHRDDAAAALAMMASKTFPRGIYNVVDDKPLRQKEVYGWLARYFDRPIPSSGSIDFDRKRGWTNKRVSNAKLRASGWAPRYPSFKDAVREDKRLLDGLVAR